METKSEEELKDEEVVKEKEDLENKRGKRFKEKENKKSDSKSKNENKTKQIKKKEEKADIKDSKDKEKIKNKTSKKSKIIILEVVFVALSLVIAVVLYLAFRPKFKDVTLELGTEEISIDTFLVSDMYKNNAIAITDLGQIDLSKVGETEVTLSYRGKEQTVKLLIQDTTAPQVTFQDLTKSLKYKIKAEDFILEKSDLSEMTIELIEAPEITEYGDYKVKISVKDTYGNETIGECNLGITWLIPEVVIEVGDSFSIKNLVLDVKEFGDRIPKSEIEKVDASVVGEYTIKAEYDGIEYTSIVKVQDTIPPELKLKDISIYDDEKITNYKKFIKSVSDASGEPTTTLKTEIDYSKIGKQDIVIEAVDKNGNKTEKTATLTIKRDTEGPVISGLTNKTVSKNATIDYKAGVKAVDNKDGKCEFTVDSSKVNVSKPGTYYATYTSKDSKGNKTVAKRKITVKHNQEDTNKKFDEFYNKYLAGKDIVGMASAIRAQISYNSNWGGDDPVWYGLTEGKGNCYVHASIMQKALSKAGYSSKIIYLEDKSHYWNLVNTGGAWRHIDATPSVNHTLGLLTDEQKLADAGLHGKTWDVDKWPAAE